MAWDLLEILGNVFNLLDLLPNGSSSADLNYVDRKIKKKKSKYFTEKVSIAFLAVSSVLLFFVFKGSLPAEHYPQTFVVASLIGIAISFVLFFLLYILELYYFKSLFKLLFFSGSVILFFISLVCWVYFRSGLFIK
ncbi:hypothetical protein B0A69_20985 [Chryseobacterium shigense]|uniref:Branched-chain amino acid ABC transporter substrate-binding protein n=1 Tax=Chryseobacterium shigense TaxID=297244 RepID=A0A1N7I678_9FLAO|nr:hypothetical protein [Chryseobacterium shigense]PQA90151.1 hypothetical protein B0A69_20985 [Chryseobacterium shigense]SIS32578.1 hypothetical protein SAMN05421639_102302 [Chryseobacterium shigense]